MLTWSEQIYRSALAIAAPLARIWIRRHSRYGPLQGRFWLDSVSTPRQGIWFQACSLGEVNTARPLVVEAARLWPDIPILLSSSTVTGRRRAEEVAGPDRSRWFPFDDAASVKRFFNRADPRAVALLETEIWPGFLVEAERRNIPVVVLNGRISDRAFPRFRRYASLFRPAFRRLKMVAAQNETYAERFMELGVPETRIRVTGSLKFDAVQLEADPVRRRQLSITLGLSESDLPPLVVFGSTRPGDDALAAACLERLGAVFPDVRWVVAPRHVQRADEVEPLFRSFGVVRLSALKTVKTLPGKVVLADTVGDLVTLYSLAAVAVIGGSFYPGVEGHNPLESAVLGVATVYGPYMGNFPDAVAALENAGGALRLASPDQLADTIERLLSDSVERAVLGARGRQAVLAGRGAVRRNLDCLDEVLQLSSGTEYGT